MQRRQLYPLFAVLVTAVPLSAVSLTLDLPDQLSVSADRMHWSPDTGALRAEGAVQLRLGEWSATADEANFTIGNGILYLNEPRLRLPELSVSVSARRAVFNVSLHTLSLRAFRLRLPALGNATIVGEAAVCQDGSCRLRNVEGALCAHPNPGYRITADDIEIHPSGAVTAHRAALRIGNRQAAVVPSLHIRPPGKPGFTAPIIGFDADDGPVLGASGLVPLSDTAFMEGSFAFRTLSGFETRTLLHTDKSELQIDQLYIYPELLLRLRHQGAVAANGFTVATDIDWINGDRRIVDRLQLDYLERAISHTAGRVRLDKRTNFAAAEVSVLTLQDLSSDDEAAKPALLSPEIALRAAVPITPMGAHFFVSAAGELLRRGPWGALQPDNVVEDGTPSHLRLSLETRLSYLRKLGPIALDLDAATRHQRWISDTHASGEDALLNLFGAAGRISAPLFRDFRRVRHLLEPYAVYRITPGAWGGAPDYTVDRYDLLRTGHGIEVGVRTSLEAHGEEMLRADLSQRIGLGGLDANSGLSYLAFRARLGPSDFHAALDGAFDELHRQWPVLGVTVHRAFETAWVDVGVRRLGPGDGPHRDQSFSDALLPWIAAPLTENAPYAVEIFQQGEVPLFRHAAAFAGARAQISPDLVLHALWYGLRFRSSCGCLSLSLTASHRISSPVPDIFASLQLFDR